MCEKLKTQFEQEEKNFLVCFNLVLALRYTELNAVLTGQLSSVCSGTCLVQTEFKS